MGMPPLFEELMQESNDEPCANAYSSGDVSKDSEDVSLPDSHALLHVTNRRKPNAVVRFCYFLVLNCWPSINTR